MNASVVPCCTGTHTRREPGRQAQSEQRRTTQFEPDFTALSSSIPVPGRTSAFLLVRSSRLSGWGGKRMALLHCVAAANGAARRLRREAVRKKAAAVAAESEWRKK